MKFMTKLKAYRWNKYILKGSFTQVIWVGDFAEQCDFNFSILIEIAIASEKY